MARRRDPVERAAGDDRDLYDVATWEKRTVMDRVASLLHSLLVFGARAGVVLLAVFIFVALVAQGGWGLVRDEPVVVALVVLSAVPALLLTWYVWRADATRKEPLWLLVSTFLLGVLFATFALVVNTVMLPWFGVVGGALALPLFFFLIVGPVEETVKLLAVRLHPYRNDSFDSVVDGAVYGAVAGLGFATIENFLYISRNVGAEGDVALVGAAGGAAAVRALAGPGHVIYSAVAGYYLGLAKFNPRNRGPIVVKGLLIAALIHATYNTSVGFVPQLLADQVGVLGPFGWFLAFIVAFDGLIGYYLYRKLKRYAHAYRSVGAGPRSEDARPAPELTEFDP
jgi:RsiW-degrading membrane proteinase PrsW (M82 family)